MTDDREMITTPRARGERLAGILISTLLGTVSLMIAFSAYQAGQYSGEAARLDSIANRISLDSIQSSQEDYASHLTDVQIWLQIAASGERVEDSALTPLLSQPWLDAVARQKAAGTTGLPVDAPYWERILIESDATAFEVGTVYDDAREAGAISARLTGASVIYSAALLLLTVASSAPSIRARYVLAGAAAVIMFAAVLIGWAPVRFGG